jgi:hypothetical protein
MGLSQKKSGPRTRPPGGPPVLGSFGARKGCLARAIGPSGRPRWYPRQCEPPAGRGGGFGGWSCTSAATRGQRALLRYFISSGLVKRAVPRPSATVAEGLAGMAELRVLVPGGGRRRKAVASSRVFFSFPSIAAYKRRNVRPRRKCAVPCTSWRSCFEPSPLNYLRSIQGLGE